MTFLYSQSLILQLIVNNRKSIKRLLQTVFSHYTDYLAQGNERKNNSVGAVTNPNILQLCLIA